mgnify:CR=1 FL=1
MAQVLKLKRTAVQGKSPTTDTLELGELAINTYDGKLYFEKDNGVPSIQSIVVTDALITGSLNINGAITASYFKGNGSQITFGGTGMVSGSSQLTSSYDTRYTLTDSNNTFSGETTFTNKITHTNGFIVLSEVSQSLNFVDDTAAAAGGVPLGGLYRNGNFIAIRIT